MVWRGLKQVQWGVRKGELLQQSVLILSSESGVSGRACSQLIRDGRSNILHFVKNESVWNQTNEINVNRTILSSLPVTCTLISADQSDMNQFLFIRELFSRSLNVFVNHYMNRFDACDIFLSVPLSASRPTTEALCSPAFYVVGWLPWQIIYNTMLSALYGCCLLSFKND